MASAEQPLKKRKLHETNLDQPPALPQPPPNPPSQPPPPSPLPLLPPQSSAVPFLSQEEILRRRRNREEIRNVYDCYKKIKLCVSQKNAHLMPDLEQAYLSLITASRGCSSVQRIVADLIPRYASCCPTALEAAAKVCINMHNWSVAMIKRGEDTDGVAYQTARACILGLADICLAASLEAPMSSVIRGICSAVFLDVLRFFISSVEGRDLFEIVDKGILKIQDSPEFFSEFKQKFSDENGSAAQKLVKLCALSLLWVFFCCPRSLLAACFELYCTTSMEGVHDGGHYFLSQITSNLDSIVTPHSAGCKSGQDKLPSVAIENGSEVSCEMLVSDDNLVPEDGSSVSWNCLLGQVLIKDGSLRGWILSRCKNLRKSSSPQVMSEITSALEVIFESFKEQLEAQGDQSDSDDDDSKHSKYFSEEFMVHGLSKRQKNSSKEDSEKFSGECLEHCSSRAYLETDIGSSSNGFLDNSGGRRDLPHSGSSSPRNPQNYQISSPTIRKSSDFRTNSCEVRKNFVRVEKNDISSQVVWYFDGDAVAMDVYSASRQLYLGPLGPDASEAIVRFQFERFGHVDRFLFNAVRGFAVIEYRNILDAIKAREVMRGHTAWGACLKIKFMDIGLGTRGDINGMAIGSSCHVYVGNVLNQWVKDETLHEVRKVVYKGPVIVNDLASEGALLMEFETPEEASAAMAHLRQHRKGRNGHLLASNFIVPMERESHAGTHHVTPLILNAESSTIELTSPRLNQGPLPQSGHVFQLHQTPFGSMEIPEAGGRQVDAYDPHLALDPSQRRGSMQWVPSPSQGHHVTPQRPVQAPPFMQRVYFPQNGSWVPSNPISPGLRNIAPPFLPPSITPLAEIQGSTSVPQFDKAYSLPAIQPPPLTTLPPPQSDLAPPLPPQPLPPPPLPSSPPPLLESQPPLPSSPPPPPPLPPPLESSKMESSGKLLSYQWQGTLSKSGVHYCTIFAQRLHSDLCKYSNNVSELMEWPAKLDMTRRTDFQHVKSTFSGTPPHKREVFQLLPSSAVDHKGFQDFISYLKQRACSGVIKIPATKSIWARLLFILPCSPDLCSMLSVAPNASDCLIALILPKETNCEWV